MQDFFISIWKGTPWYYKWLVAVILIPNMLLNLFLFFIYLLPWHYSSLTAHTTPLFEIRDAQIHSMLENQTFHNKIILERMDRFDQHQSLMYQTILRKTP